MSHRTTSHAMTTAGGVTLMVTTGEFPGKVVLMVVAPGQGEIVTLLTEDEAWRFRDDLDDAYGAC